MNEQILEWLNKIQPDFDKPESYQHGFHDAIEVVKNKLESPVADKGDAIDGWISVEDKLPTIDDGDKHGYVMTYLRNDRQWGWPTKNGFNKWDRVTKRTHTHWRPLPQPPQSK